MGTSWIVARAVRAYLAMLPEAYAVKTARKLRFYLDAYGTSGELLSSPVGPLRIAGVRRTLGQAADVSTQEPEMVRWIDACVGPDDVFWDVGANIGLYSVYAAKRGVRAAYAFEPFAATYLQLVRNLVANGVDGRVRALNLAVADRPRVVDLALRSFEPGYATSLAETELDSDKAERQIGTQWVYALSGADLVAAEPDARPDHVKIDVDGAEPLVLAGIAPLMPGLKSLFVEVLEPFSSRFEREFRPQIEAAGLAEVPIGAPSKARNRAFVRPDPARPPLARI